VQTTWRFAMRISIRSLVSSILAMERPFLLTAYPLLRNAAESDGCRRELRMGVLFALVRLVAARCTTAGRTTGVRASGSAFVTPFENAQCTESCIVRHSDDRRDASRFLNSHYASNLARPL
jgi:hypothetical protein